MNWDEIRDHYPYQWLVVEALEAETSFDQHRRIHRLAVMDRCNDGGAAFQSYRRFHQQFPLREFYFVHTDRKELDIRVRNWSGVRGRDAVNAT